VTRICFLILCVLPLAASAQDSRVPFLEQEVRRLNQQVLALSRRLDQLERPSASMPAAVPRTDAAPSASNDWVDADKWRRVRAGMSELEVVSLLGRPTSMREVDGARVLFYAMEIGASGFLGGSVKFRERAVVEVQPPVLQ
jgi:hypothetical protein